MHQRAQSVPHNRVPLARLSFRAENSNLEFPDNGPAAKVAETIEPLSEPPTPTTCSANPCAAAHRSEVASNIWKHLPGRTCTGTGLDSAERQVQPVQVCGAAEDDDTSCRRQNRAIGKTRACLGFVWFRRELPLTTCTCLGRAPWRARRLAHPPPPDLACLVTYTISPYHRSSRRSSPQQHPDWIYSTFTPTLQGQRSPYANNLNRSAIGEEFHLHSNTSPTWYRLGREPPLPPIASRPT
jgi:hypothetical protein